MLFELGCADIWGMSIPCRSNWYMVELLVEFLFSSQNRVIELRTGGKQGADHIGP